MSRIIMAYNHPDFNKNGLSHGADMKVPCHNGIQKTLRAGQK